MKYIMDDKDKIFRITLEAKYLIPCHMSMSLDITGYTLSIYISGIRIQKTGEC
jgi:hypothetical protein